MLLGLAVLYVLIRVLAVFTPEVTKMSIMVDEMPTGNIAHDLGNELVLHYPLYQTKPFAAGTVIQGVIAYPFIKLFGPSLLALKCAAIVFGLGTMLLWIWLLWRYFGLGAALAAGILFVFSPLGYVNLTTTAWGNHTETSLFTAACMLCLFWAYQGRNPGLPAPMPAVFSAGFIAGLGTYFSYTGSITAIYGFLLILMVGGRIQWRGPVWYYLIGVVAGFMPIVSSIRAYGLAALGKIDTYSGYSSGTLVTYSNLFTEDSLLRIPAKFFMAIFVDIPRAFCSAELAGIKGVAWSYIIYSSIACLLTGTVVLYRGEIGELVRRLFTGKKSRDNVGTLLAFSVPGFIFVFLVVFALSGFRVLTSADPNPGNFIDYRYFAPIFPPMIATAGIGFGIFWGRDTKKALSRIVAIGLLAFAALPAVASVIVMKNANRDFYTFAIRGDYYVTIVERVAMEISKHESSFEGKVISVQQLPPEFQPMFFEKLASINPPAFNLATLLSKHVKSPTPMTVHAYRGFGRYMGRTAVNESNGDPVKATAQIVEKGGHYENEFRTAYLEGAAEGMFFALQPYMGAHWHQATLVNEQGIWNTISDENHRYAFMMGLGRGIGATFALDDLKGVKPEPAFWVGVGRQMRRNAQIQLLKYDMAINSIEHFPPDAKPWVYRGWHWEGIEIFPEGASD